jgi:dTDP-4-dehydrorhamnose reductase
MRVMLLGHDGQLGRAWRGLLVSHEIDHCLIGTDQINLARPDDIDTGLLRGYTHLINCAAWTDVDGAEKHEDEAMAVNGQSVGALARACATAGAMLVHYSTDYVFDGETGAPYAIDHPRRPVNAYGRSKLAGEQALEKSAARFLLIRTSWLYSPWGKNFVRTMAQLAGQRDVLRVVNDQRGTPTSAEHLARLSLALLMRDQTGTFHITDGGECSWYEFALAIVEGLGSACRVEPCTSDEFPRSARRPACSILNVERAIGIIGPMPGWRVNLADVLRRLP